ncbi:tRNA 2-selenouridine synthase [compost metagenome]
MVQPTQEQFENDFAFQLNKLDTFRRIWVEDESLTIGKRCIPKPFWNQMREARLLHLHVSAEQRVETLTREYGTLDKDFLVECTERIWKRLGPEQTKDAIQAIREDRMADFVSLVLVYYDKTYYTGLNKRNKESIISVDIDNTDMIANAVKIMDSVTYTAQKQ